MLRKMLLVSPEYFERQRYEADPEAPREGRQMRGLLKKMIAHPYDKWVRLRELLDPLLRQARKKRTPHPFPDYETRAAGSGYVDMDVQT
jgi:hypothetical protein